jgi:hypothetical protein
MELGLAGGAGGLTGAYLSGDWKGAGMGILTAGLARGKFKVDQNVATKVGQMLASNDPQIVRNGIKLLARNKNMLESLRGIDRQIAKTAGAQSEPNQQPNNVPQRAGAERVDPNGPMPSEQEIKDYLAATTQNYPNFSDPRFVKVNPEAMQQWLDNGPLSQNIEDRR